MKTRQHIVLISAVATSIVLLAACCGPGQLFGPTQTPTSTTTSTANPTPTANSTPTVTPTATVTPTPLSFADTLALLDESNANQVDQISIWGKGLIWDQQSSSEVFFDTYWQGWLLQKVKQTPEHVIVPSTRGIYVYDRDGNEQLFIDHANVFDVSMDGSLILTGNNTGTLQVWDINSRSLLQILNCPIEVERDIREIGPDILPAIGDVAISPDHSQLAALCNVRPSQVWPHSLVLIWKKRDSNDYSLSLTIYGETSPEGNGVLEFSPDGKFLFNGTKLIDTSSGSVVQQYQVRSFARWDYLKPVFSLDGKRLIISMQHAVTIWESLSGKQIVNLVMSECCYVPVRVEWEQKRLTLDDRFRVKREIRSLDTGYLLERIPLPLSLPPFSLFDAGHIWGLKGAVFTNEKIVAWGLTDQFIFWWEIIPDGENKVKKLAIQGEMTSELHFSPDGNLFATCAIDRDEIRLFYKSGETNTLHVENAAACDGIELLSETQMAVWKGKQITHVDFGNIISTKSWSLQGKIADVVIATGSQLLAVNTYENRIPVLILLDPELNHQINRVEKEWALSFSPDSTHLVNKVLETTPAVRIWSADAKTLYQTINLEFNPHHASLSPNKSLIAVSDRLGNIHLIDINDARTLKILRGHHHIFKLLMQPQITFNQSAHIDSADGLYYWAPTEDYLKNSAEGRIAYYNFYQGMEIEPIIDLFFLSSQQGLISLGTDGTIRYWGIQKIGHSSH